jgi:hypothetical protein
MERMIKDCVLSFFNKHLKNLDDRLLDGPAPAYLDVDPPGSKI